MANTKKNSLRQRKKAGGRNKKNQQTTSASPENEGSAPAPSDEDAQDEPTETLSRIFFSHPLVQLTPIFLIPYLLYHAVYFITLKRPDYVSTATFGLVSLRPSVANTDPRQVLILGPDLIDNQVMTAVLSTHGKLEMGHETFDTQHYYARDGSVSWFQFLRFLDPIPSDVKRSPHLRLWEHLCLNRTGALVAQFHPRQYDYSACETPSMGYDTPWSNCWSRKCVELVANDYGCAWSELKSAEDDFSKRCSVPFVRVLHQTKHPLLSIQHLNVTFCSSKDDGDNDALKNSFTAIISSWFPERSWDRLSCLDTMGWYIHDYHSVLLNAYTVGTVHARFQIERTSPCQVVSEAGFMDPSWVVYDSNTEKLRKMCQNDQVDAMTSPETFYDLLVQRRGGDRTKKVVANEVTLDSFHDRQLKAAVRKLITALGYDKLEDAEFA